MSKRNKVLICTAELYNATEFWGAIRVLKKNGIKFDVVSGQKIIQDEADRNKQIRIPFSYHTLNLRDVHEVYDAVLCSSGALKPTKAMWKNVHIDTIVQKMDSLDKPVGGICCAVPAVKRAMKGKKVSCYPLPIAIDTCEAFGAIINKTSLTVDGNLITAEHEWVTEDWAGEFVKQIKE